MKKLLIASLSINALLMALLTAQAAQAKVKTYDAVKLAEYSACLLSADTIGVTWTGVIQFCDRYKP